MKELGFLLDEQISPVVAKQVRAKNPGVRIRALAEWRDGNLMGNPDSRLLEAALEENLVLVTYDQRTIASLLEEWAAAGKVHAGVIFVDERTMQSNHFGRLVRSLLDEWEASKDLDWRNMVGFLRERRP